MFTPDDYATYGYDCIAISTAVLRNITGNMTEKERKSTYALVTVTDRHRATIEYMHGKAHVTCECECLEGARVTVGAQFAMPLWPAWSKNMGIAWVALLPDSAALKTWCFDKNMQLMRCVYELPTKPARKVAEGIPSATVSNASEKLAEEHAMLKREISRVLHENAELRAQLDAMSAIEPDVIEVEPNCVIEPTECMEIVPTMAHAQAFYVPEGCTVKVSKVGNIWLYGDKKTTKAAREALKADGWKWAPQRKQWWRKMAA